MKKNVSVIKLAARSSIYKLLIVLGLSFIAECLLFERAWCLAESYDDILSLEYILEHSRIPIAAAVSFVIFTAFLCLPWLGIFGTKPRTTLNKLSVSAGRAAFWISIYNICCYIIFWAVQLAALLLLCSLYLNSAGASNPATQILLASWSTGYFHSLLPLSDRLRLICTLLRAVMTGIAVTNMIFAKSIKEPMMYLFSSIFIVQITCNTRPGVLFAETGYIAVTAVLSAAYIFTLIIFCKVKDEPAKKLFKKKTKPADAERRRLPA